ncbi:MAG: neutral zinc metallopeptidase, partial [Acidimicrobiales bacterium]
ILVQRGVRLVGVAVVTVVLAAACATSFEVKIDGVAAVAPNATPTADAEPTPTPAPAPSDDDPVVEPTTPPAATPQVAPPASTPTVTPIPIVELTYADAIDIYFDDVERFWTSASPEAFGMEFSPVSERIPYDIADDDTIPACGGEIGPRDLYDGNAFYCEPEDYIAWDDVGLFPDLYENSGPFTLGLVIAHEYGHAVQAAAGFDGATIFVELQSDCLAGAWAGAVARGESPAVPFARGDLDDAIGGSLTFADPLGTSAGDPGAHGTAFDRVNAFAEAFEGGVPVCLDYISDPPQTATLLIDRFDETAGNFPMEDLLPLLTADLSAFLDALGQPVSPGFNAPVSPVEFGGPLGDPPPCGGLAVSADATAGSAYYCEDDGQVYIDRGELDELWREAGDFAPSYLVAHSYATSLVAEFISDDPAAAVLAADCIVGVWARDVFDEAAARPAEPVHQLILSAGDLDEAIVGLLLVPPLGPSLTEPEGLVTFDRVAEFGRGFFRGVSQCRLSA